MNYRLATIFAKKSYTDDVVEIIDINLQDPISHLVIEMSNTRGSASPSAHITADLVRIELLDGSDVLTSMTGMEAEAMDWYNSGGEQRSSYNYWMNGGGPTRTVVVSFGRWFWDEMLALDPNRFRNLQLKISLDEQIHDTSATALSLEVWAAIFDQADISPIGFLMGKEIKAYTLTSSGHEYTDMPLDYPYRGFFLQSLLAGTEANQTITNIKLSEDVDKRVPIDQGTDDILRTIEQVSKPVRESFWCATDTSNRNQFIMPTTRVIGNANEWNAAPGTGSISLYDGDGGQLKTMQLTTGANVMIQVEGWLPHGVFHIPFGRQNEIEDWYDVRRVGSLVADITAAAVTHTARIFLQQLRAY